MKVVGEFQIDEATYGTKDLEIACFRGLGVRT